MDINLKIAKLACVRVELTRLLACKIATIYRRVSTFIQNMSLNSRVLPKIEESKKLSVAVAITHSQSYVVREHRK